MTIAVSRTALSLARIGYEPVGFVSSIAALDAFRAEPQRFAAVLLDESMPGLTGSQLALEMRKLNAEVPIVLMSGYVTPALSARAHGAGVAEVLAKPLASADIARSWRRRFMRQRRCLRAQGNAGKGGASARRWLRRPCCGSACRLFQPTCRAARATP